MTLEVNMKCFCFTIDDNIRFLKELTEQGLESVFDHPYLAMLRRLHERFGIKVQLNLFFCMDGFDLSFVSARYMGEWADNADWLKLSFHSDQENERPYERAGYEEVWSHCRAVHEHVRRFAAEASLAKTTTVHYCQATTEGLRALSDQGVCGLLGLFGSAECPRTSYGLEEAEASVIRGGRTVARHGMSFGGIDLVINKVPLPNIESSLAGLLGRDRICLMIHEQYFYKDYVAYQPDFEDKLVAAFALLRSHGYESCFFEELI
jgi:hypothetical protein